MPLRVTIALASRVLFSTVIAGGCSLRSADVPAQDAHVSDGSDGRAADYVGFQPKPSGYWSFDLPLSVDRISDDLDGVHPVVLYGSGIAPGKVGKALSLDGSGYADITHDPVLEPQSEGSISLWVKSMNLASQLVDDKALSFFCKGTFQRDWELVSVAEDTFRFDVGVYNWASTSATKMVAGEWYHVVGTYRANAFTRIYVNGVREAENATAGVRHADSVPIRLGNGLWFTGRGVLGLIDEVATWQVALTDAQVANLYALGTSGMRLTDPLASKTGP